MMIEYDGHVLLEDRCNLPDEPGIYFIVKGDQVLYIGQSKCIRDRFKNHHRLGEFLKIKDAKIHWIIVPLEKLEETEEYYINTIQPELNGTIIKTHQYPSQNRIIFWLSSKSRKKANHLATRWTQETGHKWSAKAVVEALLDLANEGEIKPVSGARRVE